jgi:hypothetical protein
MWHLGEDVINMRMACVAAPRHPQQGQFRVTLQLSRLLRAAQAEAAYLGAL